MSPWKLPPELEEKREELTNMLNIAEGVIMASLDFIEAVSEEYDRPLTPEEINGMIEWICQELIAMMRNWKFIEGVKNQTRRLYYEKRKESFIA